MSTWVGWSYRNGERISFSAVPGAPSSTGSTFDLWDESGHSGTLTLSRNGEVIGSSDNPLTTTSTPRSPPGAATYTARQTVDRDVAWSNLGTKWDTTWTFDWNGDYSEWYQFFHSKTPLISGAFDGDNWRAVARHPAKGVGTGFVSLRTTLVDTEGNQVEQTVIRAYQLK